MTRREEIREGVAKNIFLKQRTSDDYIYRRPCWEELGASAKKPFYKEADGISRFLHSQGVVIKVDRELPEYLQASWVKIEDDIFTELEWNTQKALDKAGYVAVESLIEEGYFNNERFERG